MNVQLKEITLAPRLGRSGATGRRDEREGKNTTVSRATGTDGGATLVTNSVLPEGNILF